MSWMWPITSANQKQFVFLGNLYYLGASLKEQIHFHITITYLKIKSISTLLF